jgi:hypothetical protein
VILHVDGERASAGVERDALRHRPGGESTCALEPEVVVETSCIVPLHDEDRLLPPLRRPERLWRLLRVALAAVLPE